MGIWDFYFIAKLFLYFGNYIGFHVFENIAFAVCLLIPIQHSRLRLIRQILAVPIGIVLLYYDSWLPPFARLFSKSSELGAFDLAYLSELFGRFISFPVIAALILLYVIYFFARNKFRISTFVFIAMLFPLLPITAKSPTGTPLADVTGNQKTAASDEGSDNHQLHVQPTDAELTTSLNEFYKREAQLSTSFTPPAKTDAPFDVIFLQICSLSWDDLDFTQERDNQLFKHFNIVFTNFNSAASYSGPAAIRLLRGSAGQPRHSTLYDPITAQSQTFNNLQHIGFELQFAMNHDGQYGGFLSDVRTLGGLNTTPFDAKGSPSHLQSFDGTPVYDDYAVLSGWWHKRLQMPAERVALFYNSISLHDGNRYSGARSGNSIENYHPRLTRLLSDIDEFFSDIEKSGRRAIVVFIPEHGASMRGDKMQIAGLREIPSPHISIVPVGVKLIGMESIAAAQPLLISKPVSYLAVSQMLSDFISITPFSKNSLGLDEYLKDLPTTEFVSENEDVVVMRYGKKYFIRAKNAGWIEYDPSE